MTPDIVDLIAGQTGQTESQVEALMIKLIDGGWLTVASGADADGMVKLVPTFPDESPWSEDHDCHLRHRWSEGATAERIAEEVMRRPSGVLARIHELGLDT